MTLDISPSNTEPQNGFCGMKELIAAFNYTKLTLMGVNTQQHL